jgi:hypothetical protein
VYLSPGTYPYRIAYTAPTWTVTRRDAPDLVELRVDVPGFDWPTTIGPTTLVIELPGEAVEAACVAGRERTTTPCEQAPQIEGRRVTLELGPFDVGESATVAVLVPAAAFTAVPPRSNPTPWTATAGSGRGTSPPPSLRCCWRSCWRYPSRSGSSRRLAGTTGTGSPTQRSTTVPSPPPSRRRPHGFRRPEVAGLLLRTEQQDLLLSTIVDLEQRGLLRTHVDTAGRGRWFSKATETLTLERPPAGTVFPPGDDELVRALVPEGGATVFSGTYDASVSTRVAATDRRLQQRAAKVFEAHGFEHDESGPFASGLFRFAAFLGLLLLAFVVASVSPTPPRCRYRRPRSSSGWSSSAGRWPTRRGPTTANR